MAETLDLVRGWYRRQYSGFIRGQRINRLSLNAEAWFWRVHAAVDGFGNAERDAHACWVATVGRRKKVKPEHVEKWLTEMEAVKLIETYEVAGERYLHVVDFIVLQPGGANGRRVRLHPQSPWDVTELKRRQESDGSVNPGESKGIRVRPCGQYENENEYENENKNDDEQAKEKSVVVALLAAEGLKDDPIVRHENATAEQVRTAIENADAYVPGKLRDRKAFICKAIREGHKLSTRARKRRDSAVRQARETPAVTSSSAPPVTTGASTNGQRQRAADEAVKQLSAERLRSLTDLVLKSLPDGTRAAIDPDPRNNPYLRLQIHERMKTERVKPERTKGDGAR